MVQGKTDNHVHTASTKKKLLASRRRGMTEDKTRKKKKIMALRFVDEPLDEFTKW